jgi:hypothetical protein
MQNSDFGSYAFIEGRFPEVAEPLSRYLPVVADGVISTWLSSNIPPGSWILDPFCATPKIAVEAALAGYRVLVTVHNPITRFILELLADPLAAEDFQASIAALASSYVGNERLEPHIRSLYNTQCAQCGQVISADAFLWVHGNPSPYTRIYSCPYCGDTGDHPCTAFDVENSSHFTSALMHKARAIERVVAATDQERDHVEQAVNVYNPRALYAIITIINKINGLDLPHSGRKSLLALLLYAFDQASTMWKVTGLKDKPRQLAIPRLYRENNVWLALEQGIELWSSRYDATRQHLPVYNWPEVSPTDSGLSIYEGRFISIADALKDLEIKAVCTTLPRPNQAYWTLSALWAGWLWGREAIANYKSVLHRQRYDWAWHTSALYSVFKQLALTLAPSTPIFAMVGDVEPGFVTSSLISAGLAGCRLNNIAFRKKEEQAQILWESNPSLANGYDESQNSLAAIESAKSYLELRGEPSSYLNTVTSALIGIVNLWNTRPDGEIGVHATTTISASSDSIDNQLPAELTPASIYNSVSNMLRDSLSFRSGFIQYSLEDATSYDISRTSGIVQDSLFTLDGINNSEEGVEAVPFENITENPPLLSEKERTPRASDIPVSTMVWLREYELSSIPPLTDRYELAFVDYLTANPTNHINEIDHHLCQIFTGLFTPSKEFISLCVESYAIQSPTDRDQWHLRSEDTTAERQDDIDKAEQIILSLGRRLDFISKVQSSRHLERNLTWQDQSAEMVYQFCITPTAAFGDIVLRNFNPRLRSFMVIPGSRANLVFYKFRHDHRISRAFNPETGNWRFLKFRHLRSLADAPILNKENLAQLLNLDPLTYSAPQLWLI